LPDGGRRRKTPAPAGIDNICDKSTYWPSSLEQTVINPKNILASSSDDDDDSQNQ
jgi:hypothetical protein